MIIHSKKTKKIITDNMIIEFGRRTRYDSEGYAINMCGLKVNDESIGEAFELEYVDEVFDLIINALTSSKDASNCVFNVDYILDTLERWHAAM